MMSNFMQLIPEEYGNNNLFSEIKKLKCRNKELIEIIERQGAYISQMEEQFNDLIKTTDNTLRLNDELQKRLNEAVDLNYKLMSESSNFINADPEDIERFWFDGAGNPHPKVHTSRDYDRFDHAPTLELSKENGVQFKNISKPRLPKKVSVSHDRSGFRIRFE